MSHNCILKEITKNKITKGKGYESKNKCACAYELVISKSTSYTAISINYVKNRNIDLKKYKFCEIKGHL